MSKVGQFNKLRVVKEVSFGVYLDGEGLGKFYYLMICAKKYKINDFLDVFIYFDSEDQIIATTLRHMPS